MSGESGTNTFELDLDDIPSGPAGAAIAAADSVALPGSGVGADSLVLGGSGSLAGDLEVNLELSGGVSNEKPGPARAQPGHDDLAQTMLGTAGVLDGLDALELDLDSVIGLSSPSVAAPAAAPGKPGPAPSAVGAALGDSGTLDIDLSDVAIGSQPSNATGSNATGSLVLGSGPDGSGPMGSGPLGSGVVGSDVAAGLSGSLTNAGAALSGALDSGLSLEDDDAAVSGIDLGPLDEGQLAEDGATALAGDEFDLGGTVGDDESASVVAVEPESGDSSFFATEGGESSDFTGDVPLGAAVGTDLGDITAGEVVPDTKFSVWQISGLVCCALLLLTGGFVMFDLMRTIGSPDELSLSSPLLNPLASVFGWR